MKKFLKIFLISLLAMVIIGGVAAKFYFDDVLDSMIEDPKTPTLPVDKTEDPKAPSAFANPKPNDVINVLVMGIDDARADTIMLFSLNTKLKKLDIVSIPRDTYYPREGYDRADQKKINASYGIKGTDSERSRNVAQMVSNILGTEIDYYIRLDFDAVVKIVNEIGGVEVNVPQFMDGHYGEKYVSISRGQKLLNGEEALTFVRFRGYAAGDLGRVKAQQDFIKAVAKKALSFSNIIPVIETTSNYVKTNMPSSEILKLARTGAGYNLNDIQSHVVPGTTATMDGLSYFMHDKEKSLEVMKEVYNRN